MFKNIFPSRFSIINAFTVLFLMVSSLVRVIFLTLDFSQVEHSFFGLIKVFFVGFFFDVGTISFFYVVGTLYFLMLPKRFYGSIFDRVLSYFGLAVGLLVVYFSFFAEITFWDEFQRRFNFIAVDYLIYTYEVVKNINESYPLPVLIGGMLLLVVLTIWFFKRKGVFKMAFGSTNGFRQKSVPTIVALAVMLFYSGIVENEQAELSNNRYNNELSKAGIYSFFAAFRNNELSYTDFYRTLPEKKAFAAVKKHLKAPSDSLLFPEKNILRLVKGGLEKRPNVILICVESLSADYLGVFGNQDGLTPHLDSIAKAETYFTNLYATGTRTVRGMEAITLAVPPTPGRSIVKREHNQGLFTIGEVFKSKGYSRTFFYGGDGYFDNMDKFFSGNGFNIVDRGRGFLPSGDIVTQRKNIEDDEVTFENAWGVCDEDIFSKVLKEADLASNQGTPFFNFIMTTSNHKPYTYPEGRIDIPSGTGRSGAVKYTDYAIGDFFRKAKTKSWYRNTVFIVMADHCASSAGKWELDVAHYRIPAILVNLDGFKQAQIDRQCSQIDVIPTLFSLLGWEYKNNFFGRDVFSMKPSEQRAFIGNYRKLGLLRSNDLMVLGDGKTANQYKWDQKDNSLKKESVDTFFLNETISFYQLADYLYNHGGLDANLAK
ncbi:MAG: sulfatase-like hydrolase/transferase [Bacteroidota bacterium]|uniref:Sulfatase-like hydrolase/transferase n=1 Tax=Flagellimonas profundi TaxID=2915620 RepID=A0ABS3FGX6_9FLAO|nr:alkaline phosphatase family protein [Allomuricauda profundi]MBO0342423.1 sulfatase-like hydrolase/transferase [Allomuricauda profundi]MEC7770873.1 sulfatase-like hydrolase/transferase [Bacteroidota bacterium]